MYVHSSTFNVSVYVPYPTTWLATLMDLPGKRDEERPRTEKAKRTSKRTSKGTLHNLKIAYVTYLGVVLCIKSLAKFTSGQIHKFARSLGMSA